VSSKADDMHPPHFVISRSGPTYRGHLRGER
jgi:hypothetical protein